MDGVEIVDAYVESELRTALLCRSMLFARMLGSTTEPRHYAACLEALDNLCNDLNARIDGEQHG